MRTRLISLFLAGALALSLAACGQQAPQPAQSSSPEAPPAPSMPAEMPEEAPDQGSAGVIAAQEDITFPIGMELGANFTGSAYLAPMIQNDDTYNFPATNNIVFAPGSRSGWHNHGGMVIIGTGGVGYYQEEGKPAQIIRKGDVVQCPAGVRHWHGAAPDSWFSQMVIFDSHYTPPSDAPAETPVTDEEYDSLTTEEVESGTQGDTLMLHQGEQPFTSPTFSGTAYLSSILDGENAAEAPGLHYVVFEPGVINNWHTHEGGQILIATDGIGYHQMEGQPVEVLHPGDVALCPPGVKHWHGGSADTTFAHIAISTNPDLTGLEWFDRISEEEYRMLPKENTPASPTAAKRPQTESLSPVPENYFSAAREQGQVLPLSYTSRDYTAAGSETIQKTALVYLPYGYDEADTETRYNILYLMHGWGMTAGDFFSSSSGMVNILDNLIEAGEIPPTIVVSATFDTENRPRDFSRSVEELGVFHRDLRENLIPAVEGRYRTYAQGTDEAALRASRDHRAFGGFSLGAVTTWSQFTENLDIIQYFLPMSGDCWAIETYGGRDRPVETVDYLEEVLQRGNWKETDFSIFEGIGTDDPIWDQADNQIQEMMRRDAFTEKNLHYGIIEGGRHDMAACERYLYHGLKDFFGPKTSE